MKQIESIQVWVNGQLKTANYINAVCIADNLKDTANFAYQLFEADQDAKPFGQAIAAGNVSMLGTDYENWNSEPDINTAAYVWICSKLNITLI